MRIDIVFPVLPPSLDGIGDHTARLSSALAEKGHEVGIFTAQETWDTIPNVSVRHGFSRERIRGVLDLVASVRASRPDWLIVQFEQFSYGRWGFNPYLPLAVRQIQRQNPSSQIAVVCHEDYTPPRTMKKAAMTCWQLPQFWAICQLADAAFYSVEPWVGRYRRWFPDLKIAHLPVGSNIPRLELNRGTVRRELGIEKDDLVIGLFGNAHHSRLLSYVREALNQLTEIERTVVVLYIGKCEEKVRNALPHWQPLIATGRLSGAEVSRHFGAMDLYLAPFRNGVSARRGSFLAGIQHRIPTISTYGPDTGTDLRAHNGHSFCLTPWRDPQKFAQCVHEVANDPAQRRILARAGRDYFESFHTWSAIADTLVQSLQSYDRQVEAPVVSHAQR